ncbi:MAG: tRNA (adenosine(37)-N6)-dimethylallyltransferase MiaA [Oscillospiraceae bacterium]|nr:tRNA (adenosine(37)-N6)-dimethylallyltransferase MiaA [Oscillospiraceae bacterium]
MAGKIVCICGPTASGKTALAARLARDFGGEVVSADSMQVYRGLDVGTAKVTPEEALGVPHHLIDILDPGESWSAARFVEQGGQAVDDILRRGKLPIICGGTGLYVESLVKGLQFGASGENTAVREKYTAMAREEGSLALHAVLAGKDPEAAAAIHPNNVKRVVRALEVLELTGSTISDHNAATADMPPRYDALPIILTFADRQTLYDRIDMRVDMMVEKGLMEETEKLLKMELPPSATALQAIGYKEMIPAVLGEDTTENCAAALKQATRRYAKRQLTWFRRWENARWIEQEKNADFEALLQISTKYLKDFGVI